MDNDSSKILKGKIQEIFKSSKQAVPNHVGFIMDGNRRWASENKKPVFYGHKEGTKNLESLVNFSISKQSLVLVHKGFSTNICFLVLITSFKI